jgi:hypothetical protein
MCEHVCKDFEVNRGKAVEKSINPLNYKCNERNFSVRSLYRAQKAGGEKFLPFFPFAANLAKSSKAGSEVINVT